MNKFELGIKHLKESRLNKIKVEKSVRKFFKEIKEINPFMYLFVNKGLGMSPGKMAAQVAHAAVESIFISDPDLVKIWRFPEKHYIKIVLEARNAEHLDTIQKYLEDRKIKTARIIDEGLTELEPHQFTALGVEVVDKNQVGKTFESFQLYKSELDIKVRFS